jgi:hypothetical protein
MLEMSTSLRKKQAMDLCGFLGLQTARSCVIHPAAAGDTKLAGRGTYCLSRSRHSAFAV